jgi:Flp pilus assembly protein TadG
MVGREAVACRKGRWRALGRRAADEAGGATVEAVLWFPFLMLLFALIADASLLFHRQAQMFRAIQDAHRAFSTGQIATPEAVQDALLALYAPISQSVQAVSELDTSSTPRGIIRTSLSIPARDVTSIGLIANLSNMTLSATSQHYREF